MRTRQKTLRSRLLFTTGISFAALLAPVPALAQNADADNAAFSDEIVVTAQRREEKLQEVPLAITAASGEDLRNRGSVDLRGVSQVAPSLTVTTYPNSSDTVSLNMRGQGVADAGQITKDGGVGLYIDGFYISRPQAALLDLGSPERIEVLRGPQGTLYGRNTTGGAVNIITKKPTGELGGEASLTLGSRDMVRGLASIDLPAIGNLAIKGTILYTDQDGWVKNPGEKNNFHKMGQLAGRVAARWTPAPNFTVDYAWDHGRVSSTQPYYVNPALVGLVPGYTGSIDETSSPIDLGLSKSHFTDHQLTLDWEASDSLTLRSLSSYRKSDSYQDANYGYAQSYPFPGYLFTVAQQHSYESKQYTQELQAIGSLGDMISYTGGLYYFKETGSHLQLQQLDLPPVLGGYTETTRDVAATSISKAAYLQVTLTPPVLDNRLKLTLGGRYTEDKRRATRDSWYFSYQYEDGISNNQKFHNFSPSVNLAMQWTPDLMTYVRYSRGYKAGGSGENAPVFATATYRPEKVEAWEAGIKSQFLDRKLTFNASLFYNKFKDMQQDFGADPVDLTQVSTINAGQATIKGAEVELALRPSRRFQVNASYAYLDPKLKSVIAPVGTLFTPGDDVTDYFTLPYVPHHALTVSGNWTILDDGERTLTAFASYAYQGSFYTQSAAGPIVYGRENWRNEPREVVNARLAWKQPLSGADVTFAVFANNLLNHRSKEFVIGIGSQLGGYISQTAPWSEPRVIGGEMKLSF